MMLQECKGILKQVVPNGEVENLRTIISCVQLKRLTHLIFGGSIRGETPIVAPLIFVRFSLLLISIHSENFDPCSSNDLKVENFGRPN